MKKLITLFGAFALSVSIYAQSPTFSEGDLVFNLGVGLGTNLYSGTGFKSTLPPISISGEYGVKEDFLTTGMTLGLGGYFGFAGSKYEQKIGTLSWGYKYSYTVIGVRGAVHYPLVEKLDTYGGLMLGYNIVSGKETGNAPLGISYDATSSSVAFSVYLGGRYYFTDKFAAMAELGYGIAYLNLGIALKI